MSARILSNHIAAARKARGWSQRALAEKTGVSRAEVSAVENGRQTPSAATALRLAAAFAQPVEELFSLARAGDSNATWAWKPERSEGRFWEARVGDRLWRFPVEPTAIGSAPHDGWFGPDGIVRAPWADPDRTVVVAGCDPAVGLLAAELQRNEGLRLLPLTRGSGVALELLDRGLVHAAGLHWSQEGGEDPNAAMVSDRLGLGYRLVHVARWQEGIALRSSIRTRSTRSIARARLRWVAREQGSGARHVLDRLRGPRRPRYRHVATDHRQVALAIQSGYAEAGVAVRLAAEEAGLDFVVLQQEDYELCYRGGLASDAPVAALKRVLQSRGLRNLTRDLPGYEVSRMGEERPVA